MYILSVSFMYLLYACVHWIEVIWTLLWCGAVRWSQVQVIWNWLRAATKLRRALGHGLEFVWGKRNRFSHEFGSRLLKPTVLNVTEKSLNNSSISGTSRQSYHARSRIRALKGILTKYTNGEPWPKPVVQVLGPFVLKDSPTTLGITSITNSNGYFLFKLYFASITKTA